MQNVIILELAAVLQQPRGRLLIIKMPLKGNKYLLEYEKFKKEDVGKALQ
jgi:hypothetical protein